MLPVSNETPSKHIFIALFSTLLSSSTHELHESCESPKPNWRRSATTYVLTHFVPVGRIDNSM
jgi:hypothetical protein